MRGLGTGWGMCAIAVLNQADMMTMMIKFINHEKTKRRRQKI
jgi:hypothetical protein